MRLVRFLIPAAVLTLGTAAMLGALGQAPADPIVTGGAIYTADDRQPRVEALAVRGDRFVAVGSAGAAMALKGATTRVVDLAGGVVGPGLHDAHGHFLGLGASLSMLDLRDTPNLSSIVTKIAERLAGQPADR